MATPTLLAAVPVVSARQWTTALAPRNGGGWKFITQSFNYDNDVPTEWVLIDVEEGVVTLSDGPNQIFSNANFQVESANVAPGPTNQVRAANGRIFFGERSDPNNETLLNMAYYEPADEAIHQLPVIPDPSGNRQAIIFQIVFGVTGDEIYCGSSSVATNLPFVFSIDPVTLAVTPICSVGTAGAQVRFAYYMAKDAGPGADFLYVAVGQEFWELVSIDLTTNTPTILYTTAGPGFQFIEFEDRAEGWSVSIVDNGVQTRYWLADGAITPYPGTGAPPGGARDVTPYSNPLVNPPQIDRSRGIGFLLWRPNGSTGAWTEITYDVTYKGPVDLESLAVQRNGIILGNAVQYTGFFHYNRISETSQWFGNWPSGVSQPVLCVIDNETIYISGYPSGSTFLYNPMENWAPDETASGNPAPVGSFGTKVRYPYFLDHCELNNRVYATGRQERDSLGAGVGYYDIDSNTFVTEDTGLEEYVPRGFVVLEDEERIVFSGELLPGALQPEAQLVVYDLDLNEITRWTVIPGLQNTGLLCATHEPGVIVGLTNDAPVQLYRFNVLTGVLLDSVNLGAVVVGGYAKRPSDGSLWVDLSQDLVRIDVDTLDHETIVDLEISTSLFAWLGRSLYMISGSELRYLPLGAQVANIFTPIPAPAGNGEGAAVDMSACGPFKTIMVSDPGDWGNNLQPPTINIEINNHPTAQGSWAPLCAFQGAGMKQVSSACLWMRARVSGFRRGSAPIVNVGSNDTGCLGAQLVAPSDNGAGAAVDVSGLEIFKTAWVGNSFTGNLDIEVSADDNGDNWATLWSFNQPGQQNGSVAAKWARVRRSGVTTGDAPLVSLGGSPTA